MRYCCSTRLHFWRSRATIRSVDLDPFACGAATFAEEGRGGISQLLVCPTAGAQLLLFGCLLNWLPSSSAALLESPVFLRWLDIFTRPEDTGNLALI